MGGSSIGHFMGLVMKTAGLEVLFCRGVRAWTLARSVAARNMISGCKIDPIATWSLRRIARLWNVWSPVTGTGIFCRGIASKIYKKGFIWIKGLSMGGWKLRICIGISRKNMGTMLGFTISLRDVKLGFYCGFNLGEFGYIHVFKDTIITSL